MIKNTCAILINANHFKKHTAMNKLHESTQKAAAGSFNLKIILLFQETLPFFFKKKNIVFIWKVTEWKMKIWGLNKTMFGLKVNKD